MESSDVARDAGEASHLTFLVGSWRGSGSDSVNFHPPAQKHHGSYLPNLPEFTTTFSIGARLACSVYFDSRDV